MSKWDDLKELQKEYSSFKTFLWDVMTHLLGFNCTAIQLDIAEYIEKGPRYRMVQAQRGQAKTTITAIYAVWRLIHNPSTRILIVSAGEAMANEISNWVIQIITEMEELKCMVPDRSIGDRASVRAFDIHRDLKGPEKSPSVACIGITANMQGKRADVLIADDVESSKNSQTELQRERLRHLTRDFSSMCANGDIIYLGTPQSIDSVYTSLYSRGCDVKIWPGRYPTFEENPNYKGFLAPLLKSRMEKDPSLRKGGGVTGERGKATDPELLPEEILTKKEIDQGAAYFQLQYMLDTKLMDEDRFPLKSSFLVFMHISDKSAPLEINFQRSPVNLVHTSQDFPTEEQYYRADSFGSEFGKFTSVHMYVDPAGGGQNGDETAYAVTKFCAGRVFLVDTGGVSGGLSEDSLNKLTKIAAKWKPNVISIEKNFGNGALSSVWQPSLFREHRCQVEDVWETGQKELRIIDALEPVIGSNRLIIDESILAKDWNSTSHFPAEKRSSYSLFYQLSRITRSKGALLHDDRVDALAGSVRHWVDHLKQDSLKAVNASKRESYLETMKNPLGNGRSVPGWRGMHGLTGISGALSRVRRKI